MNSTTTPAPLNSHDSRPSTSPEASTPLPQMKSASRTWAAWWHNARWPALVGGIFALLVCGIIYFLNTMVVGTEINSRTWEVRDFSFRQDPFTLTQLSRVHHEASMLANGAWSSPTTLVSIPDPAISGLLNAKLIQPERWDLVRLNDRYKTVGRGTILMRLLNATGRGSSRFWVDWTTREPVKAAVLWPAAQHLVDLGLYANLPELFDHAATERDDTEFQNAIGSVMLTALLELAQQSSKSGDTKLAVEVAQLGLTYGDHQALREIVEQK